MKKALRLCIFLVLIFPTLCVAAETIPQTLLYPYQLTWVPVEGAQFLENHDAPFAPATPFRKTKATLVGQNALRLPLVFGQWIRIQPDPGQNDALEYFHVFADEQNQAALPATNISPGFGAWAHLSRLDRGYLEVRKRTNFAGPATLDVRRGKFTLRPGYWDDLADTLLQWLREGRFEQNTEAFLLAADSSHPARGPLQRLLTLCPPEMQESDLRRNYLTAMILYELMPQKLLAGPVTFLSALEPEQPQAAVTFDGLRPYRKGQNQVFEIDDIPVLVLDTRILYDRLFLGDRADYRVDVFVDGHRRDFSYFSTLPSRKYSATEKVSGIVGTRKRMPILLGPGHHRVEIKTHTPAWVRLGRPFLQISPKRALTGKATYANSVKTFFKNFDDVTASNHACLCAAILGNRFGDRKVALTNLTTLIDPKAGPKSEWVATVGPMEAAMALNATIDPGEPEQSEPDPTQFFDPIWHAVLMETGRILQKDDMQTPLSLLQQARAEADKMGDLSEFRRRLVIDSIDDAEVRLRFSNGELGIAASLLDRRIRWGRPNTEQVSAWQQTLAHGRIRRPTPSRFPSLFEDTLGAPMPDSKSRDLAALRSRLLYWNDRLPSAPRPSETRISLDPLPPSEIPPRGPVFSDSELFFELQKNMWTTLDLRDFKNLAAAPERDVEFRIIDGPKPETFDIHFSDGTIRHALKQDDLYLLQLPSRILSIKPQTGIKGRVLVRAFALADRLKNEQLREDPAFVRRVYSKTDNGSTTFRVLNTGRQTGARIFIQPQGTLENRRAQLSLIINGRELPLYLRQAPGLPIESNRPFEIRTFLPDGLCVVGIDGFNDALPWVSFAVEQGTTGPLHIRRGIR